MTNITGTVGAFLRQFRAAKRGTTAIIFGIMVIPLMAITGGVVDYGRAVKTKSQLATALDAAILAAMKEYSLDNTTDYKAVIADFLNRNLVETNKTWQGVDLVIDVPDIAENGEMKASVSTEVSTHFLKLVGFDTFNIKVSSAAMVGGRDLEVVLVLDNTGSMSGGKIAALKSSATNLVNILMPDSSTQGVKIGLVPFAEYVNIGLDRRSEAGLDIPADYTKFGTEYKWYGCMGSRAHDLNVRDEDYGTTVPGMMMISTGTGLPWESWRCPAAPVIDLTDDKSVITDGIANMTASGWTYIPGGLIWGWRVLSNEAPFTTGVPWDEEATTKVVVLMTDGENTRAPEKWTNNATLNHTTEVWGHSVHMNNGAAAIADPLTAELCNNIKAKNIVVFSIAFEVDPGSPVQSLLQSCAGNGGQYFDADNAEQLEDAFRQIGLSLLNLRLSQ